MKTRILIPAAMLAIATCANAQMPPPPPPPDVIAKTLDKDHDHELTAREIRNAPKSLLKLDEDEDGALSEEELRPEPPDGKKRKKDDANAPLQPPPPSKLMEAIDTDGDAKISKEEIEKSAETLLKLDADDDKKIDNTEAPSLGDPDRDGPPGGGGGPPHPPGPPRGRR